MNPGILTPPSEVATLPRGLLGSPQPVPTIEPSAPVSPDAVLGLALWLDAARTDSLTFNGNNVSEWRDISGNGCHYAQATAANQPAGRTRTFNGLRAIDFDGTSRRLIGNAASLRIANSISGCTIFAAMQSDSLVEQPGGGGRVVFLQSRSDANNSTRVALFAATQFASAARPLTIVARRNDGDALALVAIAQTTLPVVVTGIVDYTNTDGFLSTNNALFGQNNSLLTTGSTPSTSSLASVIGFDNSGSSHFDGWLGEFLFFRRVLSPKEVAGIQRYLSIKWGIQVA